jgi:hypothetical protein
VLAGSARLTELKEMEMSLCEAETRPREEEGEKRCGSGGKRAVAETAFVPETLLVLESCFLDNVDCFDLLQTVPTEMLLLWDDISCILRTGLIKSNYWEHRFKVCHPITYERLLSLPKSLERARVWLQDTPHWDNVWRGLAWSVSQSEKYGQRVWKETLQSGGKNLQARYALHSNSVDEFGQDNVHQFLYAPSKADANVQESNCDGGGGGVLPTLRTFRWSFAGDSESQSYFDFNKQEALVGSNMMIMQAWSIPFHDACLVLLHSRCTERQELVWVKTGVPKSKVALDIHLRPVLVAATENCTSVVIGGNVVLIFDKDMLKQNQHH